MKTRKPRRRVLYKVCWDRRGGCYYGHALSTTLRATGRVARRIARDWADVCVLKVTKQRSRDVTNRVLERAGPRPYVT